MCAYCCPKPLTRHNEPRSVYSTFFVGPVETAEVLGYFSTGFKTAELIAFFLCVCWPGMVEVESGLPFAVEGHPSAKSHVAREMLRRLKEDVGHFAGEVSLTPR